MSWFAFDIDEYDADTMHLSAAQDGVYMRLLRFYYKTRLPLPDNDAALANIARISHEEWEAMKSTIRGFFKSRRGRLHSKRADRELDREDSLARKRSEKAKNAAQKRHNKTTTCLPRAQTEHVPSTTLAMLGDATRPDQTKEEEEATASLSDRGSDVVAEMVKQYNETAKAIGLPLVAKLDGARRTKARARIREVGLPAWTAALERLSSDACRWMRGESDKGWRADFDFLITASKFNRLVEGSYDRAVNGHGSSNGAAAANGIDHRLELDPVLQRQRASLITFQKRGHWYFQDGPKPGEPGCRIAPSLLKEFGYQPSGSAPQ